MTNDVKMPTDAEARPDASKPSAVIDKSVFHELCKIPDELQQVRLWSDLQSRYQLVVPFALVEEIVVNTVKQSKPTIELSTLAAHLVRLQPCWMDDVIEASFCELVKGREFSTLPPLDDSIRARVCELGLDDPGLAQWVAERVSVGKETLQNWRTTQDKILKTPSIPELKSRAELAGGRVMEALRAMFTTAETKEEFLHAVLGNSFKRRHPKDAAVVDRVISALTLDRLWHHKFTSACLLVRLVYWLGPAFFIRDSETSSPRKLIKNDGGNFTDEQYVISSLVCERLLTRDRQMADAAGCFEDAGIWKGKVVFLPSSASILEQIPNQLH